MKLRRSANENSTRATGKAPKLSCEWTREIERRVHDSDDPVRYMLVSEHSRSFILYYNVSDDMFTMNVPERGTLFKRRTNLLIPIPPLHQPGRPPNRGSPRP